AGRCGGRLGGHVPVPPQDPALVFCAGHASAAGLPHRAGPLAEWTVPAPVRQTHTKSPRRETPGGGFCGFAMGWGQERSGLVGAAEQLDLLADLLHDGVSARLEQLAGVVALALLILAGLDVGAGCLSKDELAVGVDVDLADAQADGLLNHGVGNAGAAVQDQRNVVGGLVDAVESLEVQAL